MLTLFLTPMIVGSAHGGSVIKSVDVIASYSAVIIMEDIEGEGTVLWIVDLDDNGTQQ